MSSLMALLVVAHFYKHEREIVRTLVARRRSNPGETNDGGAASTNS